MKNECAYCNRETIARYKGHKVCFECLIRGLIKAKKISVTTSIEVWDSSGSGLGSYDFKESLIKRFTEEFDEVEEDR